MDLPKLSKKQRDFAEFYLTTANGNATKAAELAGYETTDRKTLAIIGWENLRKPNIRSYIEQRLEGLGLTAKEVLKQLADIARGSVSELFADTDELAFDDKKLKKNGYLIKKVKLKTSPKTGEQTIEIELHDRLRALKFIGEALQLFSEGEQEAPPVILGKDIESLLDKAYSEGKENVESDK